MRVKHLVGRIGPAAAQLAVQAIPPVQLQDLPEQPAADLLVVGPGYPLVGGC